MEDKIVRGSTWSVRFKFKPEQLAVRNIKDIYLAVTQGPNKSIEFLDGTGGNHWTLDEYENTATYHFSQEDTLALRPGIRVYLECHVLDIFGERSEAFGGTYLVKDTEYPEVMT